MPREMPPLPSEGIYRTILIVLVINVLAGALLALAGDLLWQSPGLSQAGTWLALASGVAYVFFRVLGAREARRRLREGQESQAGEKRGPDQGDDGP